MKSLAVLLLVLSVSGCASTYTLLYDINAKFDCARAYEDPLVEFELTPVPNGILMGVFNKSDSDVRFDWDKSHFVLPGGETCKARSMGFWEWGRSVASSAEPSNTVAPLRHAYALVSAAPFADNLDSATVAAICTDWRRRGDRSGWPEVRYRIGNYWPTELTTSKRGSGNRVSMEELVSFVKKCDNLELVVAYEGREIQQQCRIAVRFKEIHARERVSRDGELERYEGRDRFSYDVLRAEWHRGP
jgi:hypothetical protein